MADQPISLDLDVLAPKAVLIKFQGKTIEVQPLSLEMFAQFVELSDSMQNIQGKEDDPKVYVPVYDAMLKFIGSAIPELAGAKLNMAQVIQIFELLTKITAPQDKAIAELEAKGITVTKDSTGPKDDSTL